MNARAIIEAESPKNFFRQLPRKAMEPGDEVISGTGITKDIIAACLDALKVLDRTLFFEEIESYDLAAYLRGEVDLPDDTDPEWYLFEHLFNVLQKFCPPFTYFGYLEADGSVGCWPYDDMTMEEQVDRGKLTIVDNIDNLENIRTPYALLQTPLGHMALYQLRPVNQKLWEW